MPCYEYICINENCKHIKEELKSFSESEEIEHCPKCGELMKKTISNAIFQMGDGYWFRNDYQNRSKHDLEDALKEHDMHRRTHDKIISEERKAGVLMEDD